jgi:hypothetical protein
MVPEWRGPFEGWAKRWVAENYWRVQNHVGSPEDALQECALIFTYCIKYYGETVDNPAWFMALFKISVQRRWCSYSLCDHRRRDGVDTLANEMENAIEQDDGYAVAAADLNSQISGELRHFVDILLNAPREVFEIIMENKRKANRRLCRFAGVHDVVGRDPIGDIRRLLQAKPQEAHAKQIKRNRLHVEPRLDAEQASRLSRHLFSNACLIASQRGRKRYA